MKVKPIILLALFLIVSCVISAQGITTFKELKSIAKDIELPFVANELSLSYPKKELPELNTLFPFHGVNENLYFMKHYLLGKIDIEDSLTAFIYQVDILFKHDSSIKSHSIGIATVNTINNKNITNKFLLENFQDKIGLLRLVGVVWPDKIVSTFYTPIYFAKDSTIRKPYYIKSKESPDDLNKIGEFPPDILTKFNNLKHFLNSFSKIDSISFDEKNALQIANYIPLEKDFIKTLNVITLELFHSSSDFDYYPFALGYLSLSKNKTHYLIGYFIPTNLGTLIRIDACLFDSTEKKFTGKRNLGEFFSPDLISIKTIKKFRITSDKIYSIKNLETKTTEKYKILENGSFERIYK